MSMYSYFLANGVAEVTGKVLGEPPDTIVELEQRKPAEERRGETRAAKNKAAAARPTRGADVDDHNNLSETGWGIVFPAGRDAETAVIKRALEPLLERRAREAGRLFAVFEGADGYRPGDTFEEWLGRKNVANMVVDPKNGVPFYLLLVGSPEEIPFDFQAKFDVFWGVGRLHFDPTEADDAATLYRRYAESVVAYETSNGVPTTRNSAVFATCHDLDEATERFAFDVARPLAEGDGMRPAIGASQRFGVKSFIRDTATKETLVDLLRGRAADGTPSLLLTGSHGMKFARDDPKIEQYQGALLCQDWDDFGKPKRDDFLAAEDVPGDARVHGLIHLSFACFGAGCPRLDGYPEDLRVEPEEVAPRPFVARLPQRLLSHPNGSALAALGHVDRAWTYSFSSDQQAPQAQAFRAVIRGLLKGDRIGYATDQFTARWAALSTSTTDSLLQVAMGKNVLTQELARQLAARNDARDYVVLGDPAVRLRVEDIPEP
jgi:hypothetical protein